MAQLDGMPLNGSSSEHLQSEHPSLSWDMPPSTSQSLHDQEEHFPRTKKLSILGRMKERAKKWRLSFGKKRHGNEDVNKTPSWGVSLEDYEIDQDPEHVVGSSIYDTEQAPDTPNKQMTRSAHSLTRSLSEQIRKKPSIPKFKINESLTVQSISNQEPEGTVSSSNNNAAANQNCKTDRTVEDVMTKSTLYEEKGKRPINEEDDQEETNNPNNALQICEPNHEGTSKVQDLPQTSAENCASTSSQKPVSSKDDYLAD